MFSVGIITAPRKVCYLANTLNTVIETLTSQPTVFEEPGTPNYLHMDKVHRVINPDVLGCVRNWMRAAKVLISTTDTPFICILEDDIDFTEAASKKIKNLMHVLLNDEAMRKMLPLENIGFISPYCSAVNGPKGKFGWCEANYSPNGWCGSLFTIWYRQTLEKLVDSIFPLSVGSTGEYKHLDTAIGRAAKQNNLTIITHAPTLVFHTGECSTNDKIAPDKIYLTREPCL